MAKKLGELPIPNGQLIGHRGVAGLAAENTLAGFAQAAALGLNWVEFDVQTCASGEWVLMHDDTLDRTTSGHGLVSKAPYAQIKELGVPQLTTALAYLVDLKLHPNIEIKIFPENKMGRKEKKLKLQHFLAQLHAAWPSTLPPPLVSSFDLETLQILRILNTEIPLGYVIEHLSSELIQMTLQQDFQSLHCNETGVTRALIHLATQKHLPVLAYTVNDPNRIRTLLESGITAVFSDMTDNLMQKSLKILP